MFYKIVDILLVEKSVYFFLPKWSRYIGIFIMGYKPHNQINEVRFMGTFDVLHIRLHVYLVL